MNREQLENIYLSNGLQDFVLRNTEDILKCHGYDCLKLPGYETLDNENKEIFKNFIVKIFNAFGLENRAALIPKGIYFVEDSKNNYLRFEYSHWKLNKWLHVINNGEEWY